jgi:hypothetical protein
VLAPQPQDNRAPRASYVARGDQVISHRLPSGSAMNAERPPHGRSVATATAVAPAVTAASNALSTSSRVPSSRLGPGPTWPQAGPGCRGRITASCRGIRRRR